jgi:hypothetical protein
MLALRVAQVRGGASSAEASPSPLTVDIATPSAVAPSALTSPPHLIDRPTSSDAEYGDVAALATALGVTDADVIKALERMDGAASSRLFRFADEVFEKMRREVDGMQADIDAALAAPGGAANNAFVRVPGPLHTHTHTHTCRQRPTAPAYYPPPHTVAVV